MSAYDYYDFHATKGNTFTITADAPNSGGYLFSVKDETTGVTLYPTSNTYGGNFGPFSQAFVAPSTGLYEISIGYAPDESRMWSYSITVTGADASSDTTTVLTSAPNPSAFGQSVTFTANVSPTPPGLPIPTGTVTFMDGLTDLGTGTLDASGIATFTTSALTAGDHLITADYGGDIYYNGSSGSVPQTVNGVELDIDGLPNDQKVNPGGLVVMSSDNDDAPRAEITIQKSTSDVILTENNNKVEVFTAATGGKEIHFNGKDNVFASTDLPVNLFVEGHKYSDTMRDVELDATAKSPGQGSDAVKFTVLWVDQPTVDFSSSDTVSAYNTARNTYASITLNHGYNLGRQYFSDGTSTWIGWGTEARATVHPNDFNYPMNDLTLARDREYTGWNNNELSDQSSFSQLPQAYDTGPAEYRDNTPSASGAIYALDAPGLFIVPEPQGYIQRVRNNFRTFATITINKTLVRASEVTNYFVDLSIKQIDSPQGTNWVLLKDVKGDNHAGYGKTALTWDLKKN